VAPLQPGDRSQCGGAVSGQQQRPRGSGRGIGDGLVQPDHPAGLGPGRKGGAGQLCRSSREWEAGDVLVEVPWGDNELPAFACGVT
jgi:hypothetical protein